MPWPEFELRGGARLTTHTRPVSSVANVRKNAVLDVEFFMRGSWPVHKSFFSQIVQVIIGIFWYLMYTYISIFPRLLSYNLPSWQVSCYSIAPWFNTASKVITTETHCLWILQDACFSTHMKRIVLELSLSELSSCLEVLIISFSKHKTGRSNSNPTQQATDTKCTALKVWPNE